VPARFLLACRSGHLDDFPWQWYVHGGPSECRGVLKFHEEGASLQTENLWVKCMTCSSAKSLAQAFGERSKGLLPACRGRHPHLDTYDADCKEMPRTILLGSTSGWYPVPLSVLAIPHLGDTLRQMVDDGWEDLKEAADPAELKGMLKAMEKQGRMQGIYRYPAPEIWGVMEKRREGIDGVPTDLEEDIKTPEWTVLTHPSPPTDWPHFLSEPADVPTQYASLIERVLLLKRLREVKALIGFTRIEAPEEALANDGETNMAALCKGRPEWVLAGEVHGEGVFIRFSDTAVSAWEARAEVIRRDKALQAGHRGWRNARRLDTDKGYPGIRYAMLHTFAHLLIREMALECGYNAASLRERIYALPTEDGKMAGVLIYTAAADSDGTLGGLVELGEPASLSRLMKQALLRASICSSDPLCSEHDPDKDRSLHNASCHACSFVAETSCESANRYLDRALLVDTHAFKGAAFFPGGF